jgi:hypothetical protein
LWSNGSHVIAQKYDWDGDDRSFRLHVYCESSVRKFALNIGYNGGASYDQYVHESPVYVSTWYHVGVTWDNATKAYRIRVWDDNAGAILGTDLTGTGNNAMHIGSADFILGSSWISLIDEVVVLDGVLTPEEIDQVRQGTFDFEAGSSGGGGGLDGGYGGGVSGNGVSLVNCILHDNAAGTGGGALSSSSGDSTVMGCVFIDNVSYGNGGGLRHSIGDLTVVNCTFVGNDANDTGGGMYTTSCEGPRVTNCIFWSNTAGSGDQIGGYYPYLSSCIVDGAYRSGGEIKDQATNDTLAYYRTGEFINTDPGLTDSYHLSETSVCIDVGLNPGELPITDIDGEIRVCGAAVDIGADEWFVPDVTPPSPYQMGWALQPVALDSNSVSMTATTATDESLPITYYFECSDPNHDSGWRLDPEYVSSGLMPDTTYTYRVMARDAAGNVTDWSAEIPVTTWPETPVDRAHNLTTDLWYTSIQSAIDAAVNGHVIEVVEGTHPGAIDFGGKDITLRGTDPNDWAVVQNTVINGAGVAPVVAFSPGSNSTLEGVTLTGANDPNANGGGIDVDSGAEAMISKCIIENNTASYGAGVYGNSTTTIQGCRIRNNHVVYYGGGVYGTGVTISGCEFTSNSADSDGGGGHLTDAVLVNCIFSENTAVDDGGAVESSGESTITGCVFVDNQAGDNGGAMQHRSGQLTLTNCTFVSNTATGIGGGLYSYNCAGPHVTNCIFWGNTAGSGNQIGGYWPYLSSCAVDGAYRSGSEVKDLVTNDTLAYYSGGEFINTDPNFTDGFHLASDSVCIDKGESATGLPDTDIDGDPRILHYGIDIGADEAAVSAVPGPFAEELDVDMGFSTGGHADWFGQTNTYYYDSDAAQSGDVADDEETWLETSVQGAGTLTFYWKVSSESSYDLLEFYIDGNRQDYISGDVDWQQESFTISGALPHTLKWVYTKDSSVSNGSDCGWLDYVTFTP